MTARSMSSRLKAAQSYMKEANCRDGLCIAQGKMKNAAKTIVCLPHKLVVQLEGDSAADEQDELDVIIQ